MKSKTENRFLYAVRFIACLAVIIIHTRFSGKAASAIDALARFAVPFFFVLSGRYLLKNNETSAKDIRTTTAKSLIKILKTTAIVYPIYVLFSLIYHLINGTPLADWFSSKYNPQEALWFVLFNSGKFIYDGSYTFDHLWFLFALIYVYGLIYIFAPVLRKWNKWLIVLLIFFLYFGEALQTYYPIRPFGINICTWYVMRNWLFVGMPFVLIGILLADYFEGQRKKYGDEYEEKIKSFRIPAAVAIILGIISTVVENIIFDKKEVYIGTLLIVLGIMFLSETTNAGGRFIWKLGKKASNNIYYYHVLIIAILDMGVLYGVVPQIPMDIKPFLIMIISTVIFGLL